MTLNGLWMGTVGSQVAQVLIDVDYLVVAGGGGSGGCPGLSSTALASGGGGGGGYQAGTLSVALGTAYAVTVGGGGAGGASTTARGVNGSNSVLGSVTSAGGGGGGSGAAANIAPLSGGSGGGGGARQASTVGAGAAGTSGQGNSGGTGYTDSTMTGSGGGGGAGSAGGSGQVINPIYSSNQPNRGAGATWTVDSVTYAAGGNGRGVQHADPLGQFPAPGAANTGNGAQGRATYGSTYAGNGNAGGSGIVKIRIPDTRTATFTAGVTQTSSTSGGYRIYAITAAGVSDTVTFA